jgi:hypothetical protein
MRYIFPHFMPEPEFVQPDYCDWNAVRVGMMRSDVIKLLGAPLEDPYRGGPVRPTDPYLLFGYLQFFLAPHPRTYKFLIGFDEHDQVFAIEDPFQGKFSENGVPTVPEIITPLENTKFVHYPRILDCRWYPSSGQYPIHYSVEIASGAPSREIWSSSHIVESGLQFPFFMTEFQGAQPGRFRVKAHNGIGDSEWSSYRQFEFAN